MGVDISPAMLGEYFWFSAGWVAPLTGTRSHIIVFFSQPAVDAALDREMEGDLLLGDMGQGLPFKPGTFDGCIR